MADSVRVRSAGGPDAEYRIPRSVYESAPERYVVVDPVPDVPASSKPQRKKR